MYGVTEALVVAAAAGDYKTTDAGGRYVTSPTTVPTTRSTP